MEVRGEDFVKNVNIEQEKAKLQEKKDYLEQQKEQSVILNSNDDIPEELIDDSEDIELDDIKLDNQQNNKQSYIVLAFALILLFLITIIIIRLFSSSDEKSNLSDNTFIQNENKQDMVTKVHTDTVTIKKEETTTDSLNINEIEKNEEKVVLKTKSIPKDIKEVELQNNIFEINKNEQAKKEEISNKVQEKQEIVTKEQVSKPKKQVKTKINPYKNIVLKEEIKTKKKVNSNSSKINGYYIQVGAFSKKPNAKLLNKLTNSNLNYRLHTMTIKGKRYIKLLVGPYESYSSAKKQLSKVRKISKNNKAYVSRFK